MSLPLGYKPINKQLTHMHTQFNLRVPAYARVSIRNDAGAFASHLVRMSEI